MSGLALVPMPIAALVAAAMDLPVPLSVAIFAEGVLGPFGLAIVIGWLCAHGTDAALAAVLRLPSVRRRRGEPVRDEAGPVHPAPQDHPNRADAIRVSQRADRRYAVDPTAMDDIALTSAIHEMAALPRQERTADWTERFLQALWNASLLIPSEPIFRGPDGYACLRLQLPPAGERFQANRLARQAALLSARTCGAAVFGDAHASEPIHVLTMGETESVLLFDDHRGDPMDLAEIAAHGGAASETLRSGERLLIGAPTRVFLTPAQARGLYDQPTRGWGIAEPRIGLLVSPHAAPTRALIRSATRGDLPPDDAIARARIESLA